MTDARTTLLHRAYADLGLEDGRLIGPATTPARVDDPAVWRDLGEWLMLADRLGADRVFFVGDDPVLVFAHLGTRADEADITALYRRAWSMARPRCLFVDLGDELRVYRLDAPPPHPTSRDAVITPIEVVSRAANIQDALARFHRDRFESGVALEDEKATGAGRADRRLLRDVAIATAALEDQGLSPRVAHELIERAILVRYLEDRGVLTEAYFDEVEAGNTASTRTPDIEGVLFGPRSRFINFLSDLELTRALFKRLAADFNGDLFVTGDGAASVTQRHLDLLQGLLTGVSGDAQEPLFLWAYDFSVVPTSLVSTMYELFYNQEVEGSTSSTYYTPAELVEFVVADVLSPELLDRHPRVCDPACGSGIFLVEAFRRIARHASATAGRRLTSAQLRRLLLERVAGCDIDESAVRLAAFSLYVAFLNYQTPQDIRAAGPLPRLITSAGDKEPTSSRPLVVGNAFSALDDETAPCDADATRLPWGVGAFDVVIGNPPWTEPARARRTLADDWVKARRLPLGDRSPSQQFLWRTLDLLAPDGVAALLVSAKVLFNTRSTSRRFRNAWLGRVQIQRALNFSEVRHHFFERAVAPFVLLRFVHRAEHDSPAPFVYETARPVPTGRRGSARLARLDRQRVDQATLMAKDFLWKTYSAGDHRDHALVERLGLFPRLGELASDSPKAQYGYQNASPTDRNGHPTPESWANIDGLQTFESWGPLRESWFEDIPSRVKFDPAPELFLQRTLVVRRGVSPGFGPHARLLDRPMAFRHHIYGIPLGHRAEWEANIALGTLLSAVGRYWLFMVSGAWGTWKDEVRSEQLLLLPVSLDESHPATSRLMRAVQSLSEAQPDGALRLDQDHASTPSLSNVLNEIDESAYELFDLSEAERDLVEDFWRDQQKASLSALTVGGAEDRDIFTRYANVFRSVWKPLLADTAELDAHFFSDSGARVIAAAFETRDPHEQVGTSTTSDADWSDVLARYAVALDRRADHRLLERGELRAVTDTAIIIVKRTERHFWSASAARRDAEATAAQLIASQGRPE